MAFHMTAETAEVVVSRQGPHIAIVTLNRERQANAVSPELAQGLEHALAETERDRDVRAVILAAKGEKAFCAGADLKAISAGKRDQLYTPKGGFAGFTEAPRRKFWIACVEAPALAGGLEIALACDMIVASRNARFGLPEVSRAMIAAAGGLVRLPTRVSRSIALEMIATGASLDAERAYAVGMINHLVQPGMALEKALEIAGLVSLNAPVAVAESLIVAREAVNMAEKELFSLGRAAAARNYATQDFKEGPRAFIEKRGPVWIGA